MILLLIIVLISLIFIANFFIFKKLPQEEGELSNNLIISSPSELAYLFHDFENSIKVALLELELNKYISLSRNRLFFRVAKKEFEDQRFSPFVKTLYHTLKNSTDNHFSIETITEEMAIKEDVLNENAKLHNKLADNGLTQKFEKFDQLFFTQFISISLISILCILIPITAGSNWVIFLSSIVIGITAIFFLKKLELSNLTKEGEEYIHMKGKTIMTPSKGETNTQILLLNVAKLGEDGFKKLGFGYYNV